VSGGREIAVGDPVRRRVRDALLLAGALACAFELFALVTTQVHAVRATSPWQDDPYDAVVSFTMFVVPAVVALALVRVPLCLARFPLPAARLTALVRTARAATVLVTITLVTDWSAGPAPPGLTAALVVLSLLAVVALVSVCRLPVVGLTGPDWGDDVAELLGMRRETLDPARRHRLAVAFVPSLAFGVAITTSHAIFEAPVSLAVSAAYAAIGTGGMFALLVPVGAYLRVLSARRR
jgi:hypothetical protein